MCRIRISKELRACVCRFTRLRLQDLYRTMPSPLSLEEVCFYFVVEHVEEYPHPTLALLPSRVRQRLVKFIPAVAVWRLETCSKFVAGLDMEKEWSRRVESHITAWKTAEGLEFARLTTTCSTSRESYLSYIFLLLLSSTKEDVVQGPTTRYKVRVRINNVYEDELDHRIRFSFHLIRAEFIRRVRHYVIDKQAYVDFLLYGVHADSDVGLTHYTAYDFDSKCVYLVPNRYKHENHHLPCYRRPVYSKWFSETITLFMQASSWFPRKLDIFAPSPDFISNFSNESLLRFLSLVEEINIEIAHDARFCSVADTVTALCAEGRISPTTLSIQTKYHYQLSWLFPRLTPIFGRLSSCDDMFQKLAKHRNGYSGLKRIDISNGGLVSKGKCPDWSILLFHDEIESIRLAWLKAHIPAQLPALLSHLIATRPSLQVLELTGCCIHRYDMQIIISTFLSIPTTRSQTLIVRECNCKNHVKTKFPVALSGPCQNGELKTLSLSFIPQGPCSLAWLFTVPELRLQSLEIIVEKNKFLSELLLILVSQICSPFPVDEVTVSIMDSPLQDAPSKIATSQLRSCPVVKRVQFKH